MLSTFILGGTSIIRAALMTIDLKAKMRRKDKNI